MKSPAFRALTESPLNGAPSPAALVRAHVTKTENFFVRNHGAVPGAAAEVQSAKLKVQSAKWGLRVEGMVRMPLELALPLTPRVSLEATLQCAGNRRAALQRIRPIPNEVAWGNEAIGNATWEGASLKAILEQAGISDGARHIWFLGADELSGTHAGELFGASIPIEKAMDGSVLLADTMNGAPLMPDHGAPLRVIVPGYIGARSVKWLAEVRVEREPSPNYFQRGYSVFPPTMLAIPDGHAGGIVLGEMALNSAFGTPEDGARVTAGAFTARGWALAGGDRTVKRVEISPDGGATWSAARFLSPARQFVWRLWEAGVSVPHGEHELVCRAFDSAGNSQPADPREVWNIKGYANNSWDRIRVIAT